MTGRQLVHGGDWAGYQAEYGGQPLDFSANVSPLRVPEGVAKAIARAAREADRYPDPLCRSLVGKLAAREGVPPEYVLCGNGAADLIFRAVLARKPKLALVTAPTFAEYEAALAAWGCPVRRHLLREGKDFRLGEDFLRAITPEVDMVFLCEPNNPTGLTAPRDLLLRIARRCRDCGALLVVDECFGDFLVDPGAHTLKAALPDFPNLLLLKAFTKLYAMAGVRLGYALCGDGALLEEMRRAGQPWAVSSLAQAAGEAALEEEEYVARVRGLVERERPWLRARLESLGLRVLPGEANYLLFSCPTPLVQPLRRRGILLRDCGNYQGLGPGWCRAAVRTHEENTRLIQAVQEALL